MCSSFYSSELQSDFWNLDDWSIRASQYEGKSMVPFGLLGLRAYCVTILNEKWRRGRNETQRGGTSHGGDFVDMIPPPHLITLTLTISSTQLPADWTGQGRTVQEKGRQGRVKEDLQIGHNPQETIINKAARAGSPLKRHWRGNSWDSWPSPVTRDFQRNFLSVHNLFLRRQTMRWK